MARSGLSPVFLRLGCLGFFLSDLHDLSGDRFQHCNFRSGLLYRDISCLLPVKAGQCRLFLRFWSITQYRRGLDNLPEVWLFYRSRYREFSSLASGLGAVDMEWPDDNVTRVFHPGSTVLS